MTLPDWKPDPLHAIEIALARIDARLDGIEKRLALIERMMVWGFSVASGLILTVLARVLLK